MITQRHLQQSLSFKEYYTLFEELSAACKARSGEAPETLAQLTKLNFARTKRLLKTTVIPEKIAEKTRKISGKQYWIILSEPWCGDAANTVPMLAKLADENPNVTLRILLRDKHLDVMDAFLTNGTRSIPKLLCYSENLEFLGDWGPRPAELQTHVNSLKSDIGLPSDELKKRIQVWYHQDKGQAFWKELEVKLKDWTKETVEV